MVAMVKAGKHFILWALAALCAVPSASLAADWERHPLLTDRWRVSVGSFFLDADSDLSVSGQSGGIELPEFDFEESLNISSDDTGFSSYVHWRFGSKWSLAFQYFDQSNSNTALLEEDITWEDAVLRAGARAAGGVSNEVYRLLLGRRFSEGPNHEFGAGLGVHWLEIGAFLEGEFTLNDDTLVAERRSVSAGAPLPNLGAWYIYSFSPRWAAHARIDWLSASFNEYSGGMTNGAVGFSFQAWRHVAVGLDYNYFELDVDVDSGNWVGSADFKRDGPFVHLTFTW